MNTPGNGAEIYLIRHGETAWSLAGRHTGRTDLPLTAHGEHQARALGERLGREHFDHAFTSPRRRARQTAAAAGWPEAIGDADLVEWDYGDYEGLTSSAIHAGRAGWNIFTDGCPGGESPAQITERADRLIARLRTLPGRTAVFSHGHFGRAVGARWIGLPVEYGRHLLLDPAAFSVLGREPGPAGLPVLAHWNIPPEPTHESARATQRPGPREKAIQRWENEGGEIPGLPPARGG